MSFDEWLIDYRKDKSRSNAAWYPNQVQIFEAGAASRKADVDNWKAEYLKSCDEVGEFRNRIDRALYYLDFNHDNDKDIAINILKGKKDE